MRLHPARGAKTFFWSIAFLLAGFLVGLPPGFAAEADPTPLDYARDLESSDPKLRREAAYQLSRIGPAAKVALPQLIKALEDDQQQVWFGAITALANLKGDAEPALPALLKELEAWQPFRRDRQGSQALYRTALALGSIGAPAVPALSNALTNEKWHVRAGSARALGFAGDVAAPVVPRLVDLLADERVDVRDAAAETLVGLGVRAVGPLADLVQNAEAPRTRTTAAITLRRLGPVGAAARPALKAVLSNDPDAGVRGEALLAFSRVVADPKAVVPVLMRAWNDGEENERRAAHSALLLVHPVSTSLLPTLLPQLESEDINVRTRIAGLITELGPDAAGAEETLVRGVRRSAATGEPDPALLQALASLGEAGWEAAFSELENTSPGTLQGESWPMAVMRLVNIAGLSMLSAKLENPSPSVRAGALEALTVLGDRARSAARQIPELMDDPEPAVRSRAWLAAGACGVAPERMLARLEKGIHDPNPDVQRAVVTGIARLGKAARPAVPKLIEALEAEDLILKLAAVRALGAMGSDGEIAAAPLADKIAGASPELQVELLSALGSIGTGAAPELPKLLVLGESDQPVVRRAFLDAVGRFRAGGKAGIPAIERCLKDPDPGVRAAAIQARVAVDSESESAVQIAVAGLEDADATVRQAAAEALGQLEERGRPGEARLFSMLASPTDREAARHALRAIHPTSVPSLLEALAHSDWGIREMAVDALARLGKDAKDAVAVLEKAMREDPSEEVKRASRRALRRIREG